MHCPRCKLESMSPIVIEEPGVRAEALKCGRCQGYWFAADELESVATTIEIRVVEWRRIPSLNAQYRPLFCPTCDPEQCMEKIENERDQNVVMDVCPACNGTWLDGGELEAIREESLIVALANLTRWLQEE